MEFKHFLLVGLLLMAMVSYSDQQQIVDVNGKPKCPPSKYLEFSWQQRRTYLSQDVPGWFRMAVEFAAELF